MTEEEFEVQSTEKRVLRAVTRTTAPARQAYRAPPVYRKPVTRVVPTVRSTYYKAPVVRKVVVVKKTTTVIKKAYTVRIVGVNLYSSAYLSSYAYLNSRKTYNYGLCSGYGYYNYNCIGYGTNTYSYWDNTMLSLCSTSNYFNTRCIGYASYVAPKIYGLRKNGSFDTNTWPGLIGLWVTLFICFCCLPITLLNW